MSKKNNMAVFYFYGILNDFLDENDFKSRHEVSFFLNPSVKGLIEAIGIPHTEVDAVVAGSHPADFSYQVQHGDYIHVYPDVDLCGFEDAFSLQSKPPEPPSFILDVHLGKLAKHLRLLGFDASHANTLTDSRIIEIAQNENRIILTRDTGILKNGKVRWGYWVRSAEPERQLYELAAQYRLLDFKKPFTRCLECNGELKPVDMMEISDSLPAMIKKEQREFSRCQKCKKVYWKGSHYRKLVERVEHFGKE